MNTSNATTNDSTPVTYRRVDSTTGACPECGRIDHRYVDVRDGRVFVTRTCDEHRLLWSVPKEDPEFDELADIAGGSDVEVRRLPGQTGGFIAFQVTSHGVDTIASGPFEEVSAALAADLAWRAKSKRIFAAARAAGHDPYPSFMWRYHGMDEDPEPSSFHLGSDKEGEYPFDTCRDGCPACHDACYYCGRATVDDSTGPLRQGSHDRCFDEHQDAKSTYRQWRTGLPF